LKNILLAAILTIFCTDSSAQVNSVENSFEALNPKVERGSVLVFQISSKQMNPASNPTVFVFKKEYKPNSQGLVFVGVDLKEQLGTQFAMFNENNPKPGWGYQQIEVLKASFCKTRTSAYSGKPKPRTDRQKKIIDNVYAKADKSVDLTSGLKYIDPLYFADDVIDPFGLIYRNNPYREHRGVDLGAKVGTRVVAVNSGRVILVAKKFRQEGNMVIVNHGLGIFSVYMHLSKFNVKEGDVVGRGQLVAWSGHTGAGVREPHLHFGVKIHDSYVDSLRFIETVNSVLK